MRKALVTGAAGFIGSHLVDGLLEHGYKVRGIDNLSSGKRLNLYSAMDKKHFEFVEGDIRSPTEVEEATSGVDVIFHQGAVASVPVSLKKPAYVTEVNCTGTANVMEAAREQDVNKVVVASSAAVYGSDVEVPVSEGCQPEPESPYAASKLYTEQLATQCPRRYGFDSVALRHFDVFGSSQDPNGEYAAVVPKFVKLMLEDEKPVIYGDGEQTRDFVHVQCVVRANVLAAKADCGSEALSVAGGERITIDRLVKTLNGVLGSDIELVYDELRTADIPHSGTDIPEAKSKLPYTPEIGLRESPTQTAKYFEQHEQR